MSSRFVILINQAVEEIEIRVLWWRSGKEATANVLRRWKERLMVENGRCSFPKQKIGIVREVWREMIVRRIE
jgi:hypothetical protein